MFDNDCCQVNWFSLSLLRNTDRNDHIRKPVRYHNLYRCMSQGLNQYPVVTNVHSVSIFAEWVVSGWLFQVNWFSLYEPLIEMIIIQTRVQSPWHHNCWMTYKYNITISESLFTRFTLLTRARVV